MNNGWIKLHRKILENPISDKPNYFTLWVHLLIMANHNDNNNVIWNGKCIKQKAGEFITGRKVLSEKTGIPESTVERVLNYFEEVGQIEQQKTTKNRIITILNWKNYQDMDNKWTTNGQQMDTINKGKNGKNILGGDKTPPDEIIKIIGLFENINPAYQKWYGNKTQRSAIEGLLKTHGMDRLIKVIEILPKTNKMSWITTITTPQQLEDRWATLEAQLIKEKNKGQKTNKTTPNYVL